MKTSQKYAYGVRHAFGSLAQYLSDDTVTDLFVNGSELWISSGEGSHRSSEWEQTSAESRSLATGLIAAGGRHLDELNPCVDVRLGQGIRVHAVLPPISTGGALLSIRIPRTRHHSLQQLADAGLCSRAVMDSLTKYVASRKNILITGPTGSGKTTLLAALMAIVPETERLVTIEDVAELQIAHPHVVSLETRQANIEGLGAVDLAQLVREALRMRPDRLIIGECRGPELRVLLGALNTGHDGGAGTVHASSLEDVPSRLEALGAAAGIAPRDLARQVVSAIDLVVHLGVRGAQRQIEQLGTFALDERGELTIRSLTPVVSQTWAGGSEPT